MGEKKGTSDKLKNNNNKARQSFFTNGRCSLTQRSLFCHPASVPDLELGRESQHFQVQVKKLELKIFTAFNNN